MQALLTAVFYVARALLQERTVQIIWQGISIYNHLTELCTTVNIHLFRIAAFLLAATLYIARVYI